jgi:hypothetical protein
LRKDKIILIPYIATPKCEMFSTLSIAVTVIIILGILIA